MRKFIPIALILFASLIITWPLTRPGLYTIHDDQQIARLFAFDKALKHGQFPVRWVDGLGFGFGYPLFVFYPPLVYMLGELFRLAGFSFINSIKLVFFSAIFFSGLAMYILIRDLWGEAEGTIAALFYMIAPYRALDMYVRGALAESFSFVWLPFILWSFYKLARTSKLKYLYFAAISMALSMITHNLIFLPFMIFLAIYLMFLLFSSKDKRRIFKYFLISIICSLGISAFFWIPALVEKKYTIVDQLLLVNLAQYKLHFVFPQQLWNWTWGFGGSAPGLADGISFKIGKLHMLVSLAAFIITVIYLIKNKGSKLSLINYHLPLITFGLFIFAAFMTTFYSQFLWSILTPLAYLQFPWRFLTFATLFSSILAGLLVFLLRSSVIKLAVSFALLLLLFIPNLKLFKPQYYRLDLTDQIATSKNIVSWDVSESSFEYLPKGVQLYKSSLGTNLVKMDKSQIPTYRAEVLMGDAQITNLIDSVNRTTFNVNANSASKIKVNIFDFPGWQVKIDSNKIPIDDNNSLKLITFGISQGVHKVQIDFKNTNTRTFANLISLFSILLLLTAVIKKWQIASY